MIVITAPTGNIGSQLLSSLVGGTEPIRVVARDPGKLPPEIRKHVAVVEGSHSQRDVVMKAFEGADSVFWLVPADPAAPSADAAYVDFSRAACEAFEAHGVKHVVGISALGRGWTKNAGHVTATLKVDDMIAETGVSYRALACASLTENFRNQAGLMQSQGAFYWPCPADLRAPIVTTRDVAAVAARLLRDRTWGGVDAIPMLGPEDLTFTEMAGIISEVTGKPVGYREMPMEDLRAMMVGRGASGGMAQAMIDMMTAKNEGMDNLVQRTPTAATDTPTTFRQWCEKVLKPAVSAA